MKRTASQALNTSRNPLRRLKSLRRKYPVSGAFAMCMALVLAFFVGRQTQHVPQNFNQIMAELRLQILLQQSEIDHLSVNNHNNINALSARLAELQAASTRVDALGERLAQMGQLTLDEFDFDQAAPMGGPVDLQTLSTSSEKELTLTIDILSARLQRQASQLDALQFLMVNRQLESDTTPAGWPVRKGWISSRYGERNDPFSGQKANHRGLDFAGLRGSDVLSVANGVIVWSGNRAGYGKMIEVDHGNGYQTRYAHNESLEVEAGAHVTSGQIIAKMGSTGRASAPHVHFEVIQNGQKVNPAKFVEQLR
jgi:murein DD-endopeptidase MepM/ murein hydrolase activator NlpD